MNVDDSRDALLDALASLSEHTPRSSRDRRTLARCHAAMKPAAPAAARPPAGASHMLNRLLPAAVVVYALVTVAEAIRIGWRALD